MSTAMRNPKWATPGNDMNEEQMRFAVSAESIIEFRRLGYSRSQHVACFKQRCQEQAGKDWDQVETLLATKGMANGTDQA